MGDLKAKVGQEHQYLGTIGRYSLHEVSNNNGLRLINFAASIPQVIMSTYFPDGATVNQINHILIGARHFSDIIGQKELHAVLILIPITTWCKLD